MNKTKSDTKNHATSPMDNYYWMEQAILNYLKEEKIYRVGDFEEFEKNYKRRFVRLIPKLKHLVKNELDKGNLYFVLTVVAIFEEISRNGLRKWDAILLIDKIISDIIRPITDGARKLFDSANNPFEILVETSKEREKNYFGKSFDFDRLLDTQYGYVLHVKKCLFHEALKVLDSQELQMILCRVDLGWINGINPKKHNMEFVRPVTFATGNTCQMWFIKKEKEQLTKEILRTR